MAFQQQEIRGRLSYLLSRTNDRREFPQVDLSVSETDYFTDRVLTELWRGLSEKLRDRHSQIGNAARLAFLSCSFGVNCVVITLDGKLVLSVRSSRVGLQGGRLHVSMNEALALSDLDESGVPSLRLCALRGLREELGIDLEQVLRLRAGDIFLERPHFQFGLTAVAHVALTSQELQHAVSRDHALESDGFLFVDLHDRDELRRMLKQERSSFVPHGYFTLLKILQREIPARFG